MQGNRHLSKISCTRVIHHYVKHGAKVFNTGDQYGRSALAGKSMDTRVRRDAWCCIALYCVVLFCIALYSHRSHCAIAAVEDTTQAVLKGAGIVYAFRRDDACASAIPELAVQKRGTPEYSQQSRNKASTTVTCSSLYDSAMIAGV